MLAAAYGSLPSWLTQSWEIIHSCWGTQLTGLESFQELSLKVYPIDRLSLKLRYI